MMTTFVWTNNYTPPQQKKLIIISQNFFLHKHLSWCLRSNLEKFKWEELNKTYVSTFICIYTDFYNSYKTCTIFI